VCELFFIQVTKLGQQEKLKYLDILSVNNELDT